MSNQDKAVTAIVRSMKKALAASHNLQVPHSALRASYLQALGEHPHAFAGKASVNESGSREAALQAQVDRLTELVKKAPNFFAPQYDFDGEKVAWLQAAGLLDDPKPHVQQKHRTMYLAYDEAGCSQLLAFDKDGVYVLPEGATFAEGSLLVRQQAQLPSVRRYGLPDYLANPGKFYESFGLALSEDYKASHEDLGDDSGDSCTLTVAVSDSQWERALLLLLLDEDSSLSDDVAEWVGLHYGHNFSAMATAAQLDWTQRFLDAMAEDLVDEPAELVFEWVYPDEDGDSRPAVVDLVTGVVTPQGAVPSDVRDSSVRTRLNCDDWVEPVSVYFQRNDSGGVWRLRKQDLVEVKKLLS